MIYPVQLFHTWRLITMHSNIESMNVDNVINADDVDNHDYPIASTSSASDSLLCSNFTMHDRRGVRTLLFTGNISALKHLMSLHGIQESSVNTRRCRYLLVEHLITTSCMDLSEEHLDKGNTCKILARTCTSPNTMKLEIYDILSSVSSTELPMDCLLQVACSLSIPFHTKDSNVQFNVQEKLLKEATILQDVPFDVIPLHLYFDSFDHLDLMQLHYRCVSHGIAKPTSRCTKGN